MLEYPGCELLSSFNCDQLRLEAGGGAEGQLVPQVTDEGGDGEEVTLVQLLEGLGQDAVTHGDWQYTEGAKL